MNINQNPNFGLHNTSVRPGKIEYIVIHYVGATGDAKANVNYYNQRTTTNASADFFVGFAGDIWQYNPNPVTRYCWAVGGSKLSTGGGSLYGIAKNVNCVSIEMCVRNNGSRADTSKDWYFEDATVASTIELTKYLMKLYDVPVDHVILHYNVTGKICPNPYVYNHTKHTWDAFKSALVVKPIKKSGWLFEDDHWRFYLGDTGNCVKNNWYRWTSKADGNNYWSFFLGDNGFAIQGDWYQHNYNWYYFDINCAMLTNQWLEYEGKWYYFCNSGEMVTNAYVKSKSKNDVYYFINKDGIWEGKEEINPDTSHFKVF